MNAVSVLAQFRGGFRGEPWEAALLTLLALTIVALVVYGAQQLRLAARASSPQVAAPAGTARAILDERYARGEIDTATYVEQVETLRR